jgi:hypothetical protein
MEPTRKKLLDQVRDAIRLKRYSIRTERAYVDWIKRYIYFHNVRHPAEVGAPVIDGCVASALSSPTWPWRKMSLPRSGKKGRPRGIHPESDPQRVTLQCGA